MRGLVGFLILGLAGAGQLGAQEEPAPGPEERARTLLESVRESALRQRAAEAWEGLDELRGPLWGTAVVKQARDEIERLRLDVGIGHVGAAVGFTGRVARGSDGRIAISYDFERPESLAEFKVEEHIPDARFPERDGREWAGTGIIAHRALFRGDVSMRVTGVPIAAHDFGIAVFEPDVLEPRFVVAVIENHWPLNRRQRRPAAAACWPFSHFPGSGRPRPREIFRASLSATSLWRGTASTVPVAGFTQSECDRPSRFKWQPNLRRWRSNAVRFT